MNETRPDEQSSPQQATADESTALPKDTQFTILKNRRRRDILGYLREHDGESTLSDLAEFIAADENDVEPRLLSSDERKRVYIGLYQCHLPKMDDAGVIDFQQRSGDVALEPAADQLFEYIDDEADDSTSTAVPDSLWRPAKLAIAWLNGLVLLLAAIVAPSLQLGVIAVLSFIAVETADTLLHGLSDT